MAKPWRDFHHVMGNTYGTWLPGDPRGWREAHHRRHVEGDYKHPPPPGSGEVLYEWCKQHLRRDAVDFTPHERKLALTAFAGALLHYHVELIEMCVGAAHFHILARYPQLQSQASPDAGVLKRPAHPMHGLVAVNPAPRLITGKAKSWTTRQLKKAGHYADRVGGVWAEKSKVKPVTDAGHFNYLKATYIRDHVGQGAVVWTVSP